VKLLSPYKICPCEDFPSRPINDPDIPILKQAKAEYAKLQ